MNRFHSIITAGLALAALSIPASAATFQVDADTAGSPITHTIAKTAGLAVTLPVSRKSTAFINFGITNSAINPLTIDPASVTGARLTLFFPTITKPGTVTLFMLGSGFTETFTTKTIATPTTGATIATINLETTEKKNFVTVDVTPEVVAWLNGSAQEFGFGLSGDAVVSAAVTSKEGSGTGHPAVLELDINPSAAGDVAGQSATFSGALNAASGTFTNGLSAATGTFSSNVSGVKGIFSGDVSGVKGIFTGTVSGTTGNFAGAVSGSAGTFSGTVSGNSGAFGNLTATGLVGIGTATPDNRFPVTLRGLNQGGNSTQLLMEDSTGAEKWHMQLIPGGALDFVETNVADVRFVLAPGGNIGIGTGSPGAKLDIAGPSGINPGARITSSDANGAALINLVNNSGTVGQIGIGGSANNVTTGNPSDLFLNTTSNNSIVFNTNGAHRMGITGTGGIVVGASGASVGLLTVNGNLSRNGAGGNEFFYGSGGAFASIDNATEPCSIFATDGVIAIDFEAISDARTKTIQGRSDSVADLRTLRSIEVTDYHYKDVIAKGNRPQKKVIAQQVEKVYPQAVSQRTNVVPDIYKKAPAKDGWVSLDTDLKVGERVRLIGEKEEKIQEVLEIKKGAFRTAFQPAGAEVFVYGREVKDFHTVDYDAISMLNVSATQELAKKLEAKEAELNEMKAAAAMMVKKLSAIEEADRARQIRDDAREARLNRLEAQLAPASDVAARTVALTVEPGR